MIDWRKLRAAAVLMHFDASWVDRILDGDALALTKEERALAAAVDRRAFRADHERLARGVAAVIDEFPVAVAAAGVDVAFSFFRSAHFVDVVLGNRLLVEGAAAHLNNVPARIELAIARARRRTEQPGWSTAAHVGVAPVPTGALAAFAAARASLPGEIAAAVAGGARVSSFSVFGPLVPVDDDAVLVVGSEVSSCSPALAQLLAAAMRPQTRARLVERALELGCETEEEAGDLLSDLVRDGLLVPSA